MQQVYKNEIKESDEILQIIEQINNKVKSGKLHIENFDFFKRVYSNGIEKYIKRLLMINFSNKDKVLDFGSGYGQWSFALSSLNKNVFSIEPNMNRLEISKYIAKKRKSNNIIFSEKDISENHISNSSIDLIFCYSVILCVGNNYIDTLKNMYQILKPGGKLYINANGLGWYLYNLIEEHNSNKNFSSRQMAIDAIEKTITLNDEYACMIIYPNKLKNILKEIGFINIILKPEGHITFNNQPPRPFFPLDTYLGKEMVYEIIAEKKHD